MFGSLKFFYKVPTLLFIIFIALQQPCTSAVISKSFIEINPSFQFTTSSLEQDSSYFIYISFVGRRYFKQAMKSEYIIETYQLPLTVLKELKKLTSRPVKERIRTDKKISQILYPYRDDMKMYVLKHPPKYKQFYPKGLNAGDCISEQEFHNWDFNKPFEIPEHVWVVWVKPDSMALISYLDSIKNLNLTRQNNIPESTEQKEFCYHPWNHDFMKPYRTTVLKSMDKFLSGLMKNLSKYSPYLGAQRIRLELYDNPILAAFYAEMYVHYVDSIYQILKDSLKIKPRESERFIQEASAIIPVRFKYSSNYLLWEGISTNLLDCDNTAYLAYDIGRKLGMDVFIVLLRRHAIVLIGDFAYETTGTTYFKKEDLKKEYPDIYLISSNNDSINALAAIFEIGNLLAVNGEYQKAQTIVAEGLKFFPNDSQLLLTMGAIFNFQNDYVNAFTYYYRASQKSPNDLYILLNLNMIRERLLSAGKKNLVLAIINRYK